MDRSSLFSKVKSNFTNRLCIQFWRLKPEENIEWNVGIKTTEPVNTRVLFLSTQDLIAQSISPRVSFSPNAILPGKRLMQLGYSNFILTPLAEMKQFTSRS